jgi:hypothetical protein
VTEEFGLEQRFGEGRAVGDDEGAVLARAVVVEGAGDDVLAGPGLAGDEHGAVGGRDLGDELHDLAHAGRGADHVADAVPGLEFGAEPAGQVDEVLAFERAGRGDQELRRADGFFEVVEGPELDGFDGRLDRGVSRDDEDFGVGRDIARGAEQLDAVHLRHFDVEQEQVEVLLAEQIESFAGRRGGRDPVALVGEDAADALANHLFVIDGEHSRRLGPGLLIVHDRDSPAGWGTGSSTVKVVPVAPSLWTAMIPR